MQDKKPLRVKHTFNSGDLITILPGLKHIYDTEGRKSIIMQVLDFEAFYYDGCKHTVKSAEGKDVTMNRKMWWMMVPLLNAQPYIEHCEIWEGQEFDISFDDTRDRRFIPMPNGSIHHWPFFLVPELQCDLSKRWLFCVGNHQSNGKIVVNLTERYRNPYINYYFLKQYENDLIFAGTPEEHAKFCEQYKLSIDYLEVENFYELAVFIKECRFIICNQSFCFHIADSMKVPRVLEICSQFPNTFPTGENGYAFLYQQALELYVYKLFNQ